MKKSNLILLFILISLAASGQISVEKLAINRMEKGKWQKAKQLLFKSLRKDSLNPEARLLLSKLYFSPAYVDFNIDSSYYYIRSAMTAFTVQSARQKDRLKRFPLDSIVLEAQRKRIDSAAFERAKRINTEQAYSDFLFRFDIASEKEAAEELRNEVAYVDALKVNTYGSFQAYLIKYPSSSRANEAHQRYEKLLYEDKTQDGKLASYEKFLNDYPKSLYSAQAEKNIFEILTIPGTSEAFNDFLIKYPRSAYIKKAVDILYHLEDEAISTLQASDSISSITTLNKGYLVPILKNGKFGFMNTLGEEILTPQFSGIHASYLCGAIRSDYLIVSEGLIGRSGKMIAEGKIDQVDDLGTGFLKLSVNGCTKVIHKSGFMAGEVCVEDSRVIAGQFLAIKKNGKWALFALSGKQLLSFQFEEIYALENVVVFIRTGKRILSTTLKIADLVDGQPLDESMVFDEVRRLDMRHFLVRNGTLEGVLDPTLSFVVPFDRHVISQSPYGFIIEKNKKFQLRGVAELNDKEFDRVRFYHDWMELSEEKSTSLYDGQAKKYLRQGLDSVWFTNKVAFAEQNDSLLVFFSSGKSLRFIITASAQFIKSADSTGYFYVPERNKNGVYKVSTGQRMFSAAFDDLTYLGQGVFLIEHDGKKGLISETGNLLLPIEYAAIVPSAQSVVSILKDRKFGLYDLAARKLIKPVFERNVLSYNEHWLLAFKGGMYGFIDWDSKPVSSFEFEEVRYWNDSVAWVKSNFQWGLYDIRERRIRKDRIKDYHLIANSDEEKVAIIHWENFFGVISNKYGEIIPPTYSDMLNLGTVEEPLYFAEKHIEEAGIYVVIYFDRKGKVLRKQAFEEEEYSKIYCDEN